MIQLIVFVLCKFLSCHHIVVLKSLLSSLQLLLGLPSQKMQAVLLRPQMGGMVLGVPNEEREN